MSRFQPRKAVKQALKARIALDGPAGAGKTSTALEVAHVLGKRVLLIDTEHRSSELYADMWDFDVVSWDPPFDPRELAETVEDAGKSGDYDVLIVDSLSHYWSGEGGTLDIVDAAAERVKGNRFAGWKTGTPAQNDLVEAILRSPLHFIGTMRAKTEYVQEQVNGRTEIRRVGLAPIQRDQIEFEFTVTANLNIEHTLVIDKTRCFPLGGKTYTMGHAKDMAETLGKWLEAGEPVAPHEDVEALRSQLNALSGDARRAYREKFGRPEHLLASQLDAARAFVASLAADNSNPPPEGGGSGSHGEGRQAPSGGETVAEDGPTAEEEVATDAEPPVDVNAAAATAPAPPLPVDAADSPRVVFFNRRKQISDVYRGMANRLWAEADLPLPAEVTDEQIPTALDVVERVLAEQQKDFDRRRKAANAAMSKIGVKTDDARHELVGEATGGATTSTAALSQDQLDAVKRTCDVWAQRDAEAEAS